MAGLFRRINFFKGLFMKTSDWKREQEYHMEKQRFHSKYLHTPGVIFNCLGGLRVSVSEKGHSLVVAPGYAIDGEGHDLYVPETKEILIPDLQSFDPPSTIYISLRYSENMEDRREDTANPMYSGHACVAEDTIIEITTEKPDNHHTIELGHVCLSENAARIRNPQPPAGAGKIVTPAGIRTGNRRTDILTVKKTDTTPLDELILTDVPKAGATTRAQRRGLSISDLGEKLLDTQLVVIAGNRKQEDTSILIEQYPKQVVPPMYLVFAQSLDGVRIRWSVVSTENDKGGFDYYLHVRNESTRTTTVMCRVYRVRQ
jgi:hypothetical protein